MKAVYWMLILSVAAVPVLYGISLKLAVVYLLIWADKLVLGLARPLRYFGFELTTLASVLSAIFFGPVASFFLVLVLFTVLQSLRYLVVPILIPDWPLFVPNRDSVVYALGGVAAAPLLSFGFYAAILGSIAVKYALYFIDALMKGKQPRVLSLAGTVLVHVALIIPFGLQLIKWIS